MRRFFRKLFAFFRGTFLADCPVCHKHFYGTNTHASQVRINGVHYRIICHRCAEVHVPRLPPPNA